MNPLKVSPTRMKRLIAGCLASAVVLSSSGCSSDEQGGEAFVTSANPPGSGPQQFAAVTLNSNGSSPGGANSAEVVAAAAAFLATLDVATRDRVVYDFSDSLARQTWSNIPATVVPRNGVVLSALAPDQLRAAYTMMQTALAADGYHQDENIQRADDFLAGRGGPGAAVFGSLTDYYVAIYGEPSPTEPFMVQFTGHHLARNLTYHGDKVSQTPQFVGSDPISFVVDGTTIAPLAAESTAMSVAIASLTSEQRASAEITSGTFDEVLMGPGMDTGDFPVPEGVPLAGLDARQRSAVMAAIETFAGDVPAEAATRLMAKYASEMDQTRIGWSNSTGLAEENSYIRIDGPSVWIEFITTRLPNATNIHYHSVYRDKTNDYGSSKPG